MMGIYLKLFLMRITGYQAHPVDKNWDALLNEILDEGTLLSTNKYVAQFIYKDQQHDVWMENGLFSLGASHRVKGELVDYEMQRLVTVKTTLRFYRMVYLKHLENQKTEREEKSKRLFS